MRKQEYSKNSRFQNHTTTKHAHQTTEKAYKLLSATLKCSHKYAKSLIDKGLVLANGTKIDIARAELSLHTNFEVLTPPKPSIIFQNHELLALEKPPLIESYTLCEFYEGWNLLHRLDYETSGVILLIKEGSDFHIRAKTEFKNAMVYKEYTCVLHGILAEPISINKAISTTKTTFARSVIDKKGKTALTELTPLQIEGKKTLAKAVIKTGRTHQIRVHCQSIEHPIVGDRIYGKKDNAKRLFLHARKIALLGYEILSPNELTLQGLSPAEK